MAPRNPNRTQASLGIHEIRREQLRYLADSEGVTMSDLVEEFISSCMISGRIPDQLPGFEIVASDSGVFMRMQGLSLVMTADEGRRLAANLLGIGNGQVDGLVSMQLSEVSGVTIGWRGRAIALRGFLEGDARQALLSPSMLRDLARQLTFAADKLSGGIARRGSMGRC